MTTLTRTIDIAAIEGDAVKAASFTLARCLTTESLRSSGIPIEVVLEAPIPADEVELHIEASVCCILQRTAAPVTSALGY